jgi:hypothetical protein
MIPHHCGTDKASHCTMSHPTIPSHYLFVYGVVIIAPCKHEFSAIE